VAAWYKNRQHVTNIKTQPQRDQSSKNKINNDSIKSVNQKKWMLSLWLSFCPPSTRRIPSQESPTPPLAKRPPWLTDWLTDRPSVRLIQCTCCAVLNLVCFLSIRMTWEHDKKEEDNRESHANPKTKTTSLPSPSSPSPPQSIRLRKPHHLMTHAGWFCSFNPGYQLTETKQKKRKKGKVREAKKQKKTNKGYI